MIFMYVVTFLFTPWALAYDSVDSFMQKNDPVKALVFLSKDCPCSRSHVDHLNQVSREFPSIPIYGVITDTVGPLNQQSLTDYFNIKNFYFPLIKDSEQKLVQQFKALKTPHVVLLKRQPNNNYTIIYEGGATDQRDASLAKTFFLKENLKALQNKEPLPFAQGKSLGCYIRRL